MEYDGELIAVYNDQNLPLECQIISKFKNEDTGKDYLVYTDNSRNGFSQKNVEVNMVISRSRFLEIVTVNLNRRSSKNIKKT